MGEAHLVLRELRVSSRRRQPALPALTELGWPSVPSPSGLLLQGNGGTPDKHLPAPVPKLEELLFSLFVLTGLPHVSHLTYVSLCPFFSCWFHISSTLLSMG